MGNNFYPIPNRLLDICQGTSEGSCMMLFMIFEHMDQNLAEYISDHNLVAESKIKVILFSQCSGKGI